MDESPWLTRRTPEEWLRLMAGGVIAIVIGFGAIYLFPEYVLVVIGVLGLVGKVGMTLTRQRDAELPPASDAFRALADPSRPLAGLGEADRNTFPPPPAERAGAGLESTAEPPMPAASHPESRS